jgi:predicted enzyme related to lactoylglutathione lyase
MNPICYAELHTAAPAEARRFYADLFGWEMNHHAEGDYTEIKTGDGGPEAGLMGVTPHDATPQWVTYVAVPDVDAAAARAIELGAKVRMPRTEIPGTGWFAWLDDPTGARFALFQRAAAR